VAQASEEKTKLLQRVRRLRGQVEAIERALEAEAECPELMQLAVSVRGAASSLIAELLEAHIREQISDPAHDRDRDRARAAKQLIEVLHAYIK
jgi:DNA-binding FrmR family transcriptional regulator